MTQIPAPSVSRRRRPSTNAVAITCAIVCVLSTVGSSAWAVAKITGKNIKDNTVESRDIKNHTISGADVGLNSLTGASVHDASLVGADLANGTVTGSKLAAGTVGVANLAPAAQSTTITAGAPLASVPDILFGGTVLASQSLAPGSYVFTAGGTFFNNDAVTSSYLYCAVDTENNTAHTFATSYDQLPESSGRTVSLSGSITLATTTTLNLRCSEDNAAHPLSNDGARIVITRVSSETTSGNTIVSF